MEAAVPTGTSILSCWPSRRNCLSAVKMACLSAGALAPVVFPVPTFVQGALVFSSSFLLGMEILKRGAQQEQVAGEPPSPFVTRTWEQLTAGAVISGVFGGLGMSAIYSGDGGLRILGGLACLVGIACATTATLVDRRICRICQGEAPEEVPLTEISTGA